jgi:putative acetyltransferase
MQIRSEDQKDWPAVYIVNATAFETEAEAKLVDTLRENVKPLISLVAEVKGTVVGHILFSPVELKNFPDLKLMGLAPMAVAPNSQNQGLGSALVHSGLEKCRELDIGAVVVLGHPNYYPRFGFKAAKDFNISCEYGPCEDSFMLAELKKDYLKGASGIIMYNEAFNEM